MHLIFLMIIPVLIGLVALFTSRKKVTIKEFISLEAICLIVLGAGWAIARYTSTTDQEIISGRITQKAQDRVSCRHSYQCNCITTCTGGKTSTCTTICQTCYEHSFDYDWNLYTNINKTIGIETIDRQGLEMPPRWGKAYVNEPVAIEQEYTNYIKANPKTVLRRIGNKEVPGLPVPKPPVETHDYYRVNRYLTIGFNDPEAPKWNWLLNELNATYGPTKQVNVVVVAVKTADPNYSYLLEEKWLGGKKNDLILLLGTPNPPNIEWAKIISWSRSEDLKVELRDDILEIGSLNRRDDILAAAGTHIKTQWVRRSMKDFEYLMVGMQPSPGWMIALFIIGLLLTCGLTIYFWTSDPFEDEIKDWYRKRRY